METKEAALKAFEKHYSEWEANESLMNNGYTYEFTFIEMMRRLSSEVLEASTGKVSKGKNVKKSPNKCRYI